MTWLQAQMVCGLRPGLDGNYYGVIAAQQLFEGYPDNQLIYQDVTERGIEVVLTHCKCMTREKESSDRWDVFLSIAQS